MDEAGSSAEQTSRFLDALQGHATDGTELHSQTTPREQALLVYALKLTRTPTSMTKNDVVLLREAGLDDGEILDANLVTSYFAYANRVADGLGIQLEGRHQDP